MRLRAVMRKKVYRKDVKWNNRKGSDPKRRDRCEKWALRLDSRVVLRVKVFKRREEGGM